MHILVRNYSKCSAVMKPRLQFALDAIKKEQLKSQVNHPKINWYPGHIAKAERELKEYIKKVDVVVEVRDARIPNATTHPMVPEWVHGRKLIVALMRIDQAPHRALNDWRAYFQRQPPHTGMPVSEVHFIDGRRSLGVDGLRKAILASATTLNAKREALGIAPRPVRALVIGFPNTGKSTLINKILCKKIARCADKPGVTRSLHWVRIGGDDSERGIIDLLDSPGIIPTNHFNQSNAMKLAVCNDIGTASYQPDAAAIALCDYINEIYRFNHQYVDMELLENRFKVPFYSMTGHDIVSSFAARAFHDNMTLAANKILTDFRKGHLGYICLDAPQRQYRLVDTQLAPDEEAEDASNRNNRDELEVGNLGILRPKTDRGAFDGW